MKAYGATSSRGTASDVAYGDGCLGSPTRLCPSRGSSRRNGRRLLHKMGRREGKKACEASE